MSEYVTAETIAQHVSDLTGFRGRVKGTLHASITPKHRGSGLDGLLAGNLAWGLLKAGKIEVGTKKYQQWFYAPTYYLIADPPINRHWRAQDGTLRTVGGSDRNFIFSIKGKVDFHPLRHHKATVDLTARMDPWRNGLGAKLTRITVHDITPHSEAWAGPDERSGAEVIGDTMAEISREISDMTGKATNLTIGPRR